MSILNLNNFYNFLVGKNKTAKKLESNDIIAFGRPDSRSFNNFNSLGIRYSDFLKSLNLSPGASGPVCDITMEQKTVTFGPEVTVSIDFNIQLPIPDVLIPGVLEVLPEAFMNIWLNVAGGGFTQIDTWNTQYSAGSTGYGDLSDVETRTYEGWNIFSSVNEETVLFDPISNTYWKFYFTSYDFRNGFTYTRSQIFLPALCELTFSDGSKMNSASSLVTGPTVTENVDLNGVVTYTVGGSTVLAGRVVYVDAFNGSDTTGLINDFTKPFRSIYAAINHANSNGSPSASNRCLVYVRRGNYTNNYIYMQNYVDVYCEPGVKLEGNTLIRDNGAAITANFLGYADIYNWSNTTVPLLFTGASKMVIEFDRINCSGAAMSIYPTDPNNNFLIKGNYIYSNANGTAFGSTIRYAANVTLDLKTSFDSIHAVLAFRYFTGKMTVNVPDINLVSGNIYGGNFKHCLWVTDSNPGTIIVNGNLNVKDTVYYGGTSAALHAWAGANPKLTINGNINGEVTHGTYLAGGAIYVTINGNVSSQQYPIIATNSTSLHVKNSLILKKTVGAHFAVSIQGSAQVYLSDSELYSESETSLIDIQTTPAKLFVKNVSAEGLNDGVGNSIVAGAATPTIGLYGFITNKAVDAGVVNTYATPYILEPNLNVPKFY